MSLLIRNPWIVTMNDNYDIFRTGYVYVQGDKIAEVGTDMARMDQLSREAGSIIDAADKILMPGMVSAHTHLFQTFIRGLADDLPLYEWLSTQVWPFAEHMQEDDFYYAALIGCIENLKTGATSIIDQDYINTSLRNSDRCLQAMKETGIRGNFCRCYANIVYYEKFRETNEDMILDDIKRLHSQWHGSENGRLTISAGPLNPWGVSPDLFIKSKQLSKDLGIKFQVHTAEDQEVVTKTAAMYDGKRNLEFFEDLGILDEDTQLAHAIWLDDHEMEILAKYRCQPIHCPVANAYLADGVARVPEWLKMGLPVALGTDGPGSNNAQDMLGTLKPTALMHKNHNLDAHIISNRDVLTMATRNGAVAMGMDGQMGQIAPGQKADIILVDWKKPHIAPVHYADSALVNNANGNDVDTVIVDGEVVVRNKRSTKIDEVALIDECQKRVEFIKKHI